MPIDVTENFIHIRVEDPGKFEKFRYINIKGQTIRAKLGKLKGKDKWIIQAYVFDKKSYNRETAEAWVKKHPKSAAATPIQFNYVGSVEPLEKDGKFYAKLYIMDSDLNGNDWGVTPEGQKNMVTSLKYAQVLGPAKEGKQGEILGGPLGTPHYGYYDEYGSFTDFITSGNMTFGLAEISDPYAQEKIRNKEWDAVSPSVIAFSEYDDAGKAWVTDGIINHVLFVEKGGYPKAGVLETFGASYQAALRQSQFGKSSDLVGEKVLGVSKRKESVELHFDEGVLKVGDITFEPILASREIHGHKSNVTGSSHPMKGTQDPNKEKNQGGNKTLSANDKDSGNPPTPPTTQNPPTGDLNLGWPTGEPPKDENLKAVKELKEEIEKIKEENEKVKEEKTQMQTWMDEQKARAKATKIADIVQKQVEAGLVAEDKRAEAIKKLEEYDDKTLEALSVHAAQFTEKIKQASSTEGQPAPPEIGMGSGPSETDMTVGMWDPVQKKWVGGIEING